MQFYTWSYRSFPPGPSDQRRFWGADAIHRAHRLLYLTSSPLAVVTTFVTMAPIASLWQTSVSCSQLIRSTVTAYQLYLGEMLPQPGLLLAEERFSSSRRQVLPTSGATDLEPGDLLGVPPVPIMPSPIVVFQSTNSAPAVSPPTNAPEVADISEPSLTAAATAASPSPALFERSIPEQRISFLHVWHHLSRHLRNIFSRYIARSGLLRQSRNKATSSANFWMFFPAPKRALAPTLWCPLKFWYLSAVRLSSPGHIASTRSGERGGHHSQSVPCCQSNPTLEFPYSIPLVVVPNQSGGGRFTINYKKLNKMNRLSQLPIPRVDQVLGSLGKGRVFSPFDQVPPFHHITAHKDKVPFIAF